MPHALHILLGCPEKSIPLVQPVRRAVPLLSPSNNIIAGDLQQCRVSLQLVGQDAPVTGRLARPRKLGGHDVSMC